MDVTFYQVASLMVGMSGIMVAAVIAISWNSARQLHLFRNELKGDMSNLRDEFKGDMSNLRDKFKAAHDSLVLLIEANRHAITRSHDSLVMMVKANSDAITRSHDSLVMMVKANSDAIKANSDAIKANSAAIGHNTERIDAIYEAVVLNRQSAPLVDSTSV